MTRLYHKQLHAYATLVSEVDADHIEVIYDGESQVWLSKRELFDSVDDEQDGA